MATLGQTTVQKYQNLLKKSPTAYSPGVKPTKSDISAQISLLKAQKGEQAAETETLKKQWYSGETPTGEAKTGYLRGFLRTMAAPGSAIVGAVETALGKGTKEGLVQNIAANVKEGGTAGDLLRNMGVPNTVSMPLGLALDIALDPINWATAGSAAFIPRLAMGASAGVKTGVGISRGLQIAAKSGALTKAEKFGRILPGLVKATFEEGVETGLPKFYRKVSEKAVESRLAFEELTGNTVEKMLEKSATVPGVFERLQNKLSQSPAGQKLIDYFGYDSRDWFRKSIASDEALRQEAQKLSGTNSLISRGEEGKDATDIFLDAAQNKRRMPIANSVERDLNEGLLVAENPSVGRSADSLENTYRLKGEAIENKSFKKDLKNDALALEGRLSPEELVEHEKSKLREVYISGVKTYDNLIEKTIASPRGRSILKGYSLYLGLFKNSKIGGNLLSAGTNGVVGNLAMTAMSGVDILNLSLFNNMKRAIKIIRGKNYGALNDLVGENGWREVLEKYPETFKSIFSLEPQFVLRGKQYIEEATVDIVQKLAKGDRAKMSKLFEEANKATRMFDETVDLEKTAIKLKETIAGKRAKEAVSTVEAAMGETPTTFLSQEVLTGPYIEFVQKIEKAAKETGNPFYKALHWYLTAPMEGYNKVDQTYRLGLALHLTRSGVSESELKLLARRLPITAGDAIQIPGRNVYKIKPLKAMEIAQDIYMNYLAMPAFVKMMRTMPILGAPFFSFVYGMSALTAKTMAYNPSLFNKVQFLLHEISGDKSPLEKEALAGKYYKWLDKEGMLKLPFFKENPVYLNVENMLPYYTLNIFQPSERTYGDKFGDTVAALIDKAPFFKTPEGQVMLDYAILPMMLGQAQGMFGQPLWTNDASILEKVGRAAQAGAETVVPPLAGLAGPAIPEAVLPYIPSYRARQLGYAWRGKSSLGIPVQEPAVERTARVMGAMAGWPTYKIKLSNK